MKATKFWSNGHRLLPAGPSARAVAVLIKISLIAVLANWPFAIAAAADNLYRPQATVTGQGEANRIIGFAACFEDVLIKVSGALKPEGDPRLSAYKIALR